MEDDLKQLKEKIKFFTSIFFAFPTGFDENIDPRAKVCEEARL